jgi:hypothetical protein
MRNPYAEDGIGRRVGRQWQDVKKPPPKRRGLFEHHHHGAAVNHGDDAV